MTICDLLNVYLYIYIDVWDNYVYSIYSGDTACNLVPFRTVTKPNSPTGINGRETVPVPLLVALWSTYKVVCCFQLINSSERWWKMSSCHRDHPGWDWVWKKNKQNRLEQPCWKLEMRSKLVPCSVAPWALHANSGICEFWIPLAPFLPHNDWKVIIFCKYDHNLFSSHMIIYIHIIIFNDIYPVIPLVLPTVSYDQHEYLHHDLTSHETMYGW